MLLNHDDCTKCDGKGHIYPRRDEPNAVVCDACHGEGHQPATPADYIQALKAMSPEDLGEVLAGVGDVEAIGYTDGVEFTRFAYKRTFLNPGNYPVYPAPPTSAQAHRDGLRRAEKLIDGRIKTQDVCGREDEAHALREAADLISEELDKTPKPQRGGEWAVAVEACAARIEQLLDDEQEAARDEGIEVAHFADEIRALSTQDPTEAAIRIAAPEIVPVVVDVTVSEALRATIPIPVHKMNAMLESLVALKSKTMAELKAMVSDD
jgi:hypothetical protein